MGEHAAGPGQRRIETFDRGVRGQQHDVVQALALQAVGDVEQAAQSTADLLAGAQEVVGVLAHDQARELVPLVVFVVGLAGSRRPGPQDESPVPATDRNSIRDPSVVRSG